MMPFPYGLINTRYSGVGGIQWNYDAVRRYLEFGDRYVDLQAGRIVGNDGALPAPPLPIAKEVHSIIFAGETLRSDLTGKLDDV
jgi:hypothetical protein